MIIYTSYVSFFCFFVFRLPSSPVSEESDCIDADKANASWVSSSKFLQKKYFIIEEYTRISSKHSSCLRVYLTTVTKHLSTCARNSISWKSIFMFIKKNERKTGRCPREFPSKTRSPRPDRPLTNMDLQQSVHHDSPKPSWRNSTSKTIMYTVNYNYFLNENFEYNYVDCV